MGTLQSNLEVSFEVNKGNTKNAVGARAWKAVSECVGNDYDPNKKVKTKGVRRNRRRKQNLSDTDKTQNESTAAKNQQKQVQQNPPQNLPQININNL